MLKLFVGNICRVVYVICSYIINLQFFHCFDRRGWLSDLEHMLKCVCISCFVFLLVHYISYFKHNMQEMRASESLYLVQWIQRVNNNVWQGVPIFFPQCKVPYYIYIYFLQCYLLFPLCKMVTKAKSDAVVKTWIYYKYWIPNPKTVWANENYSSGSYAYISYVYVWYVYLHVCGPLNMCSTVSPAGTAREFPLGP